ncbi:MAG: serine hydrolase [Catenulispora sp. 13_1_20CM_3_70_7]|nr:MAG: serine hydrolase [Catenulispora sp. 13_1_20CM_3_70_7]
MLTGRPGPDDALVRSLQALPGDLAFSIPGWGEHRADEVFPLASVGKLLLLMTLAHGFAQGDLDPEEPLILQDEDYCAGSGLLLKLSARRWTLSDLARLTAAVSDNTATNALLRRVGLDRVATHATRLGLKHTHILDRIREPRRPEHPPAFAVGTARELADLAAQDTQVLEWMASCTDRGMVAAAIPHEPEDSSVREVPVNGLWVANKTGTDVGVRCDVGVVRGTRQVCYAVLTRCAPGREFEMVRAMRVIGAHIATISSATRAGWPR